MKNILYIACFAVLCLFYACEGMDAPYKEFIEDGPIIYIGKADSVKVYGGRNRVEVYWNKQSDPRAKTATVFWENKTKHQDVTLDRTKPTSVIVDNLLQGSCVFEIYTYDSYGNKSIVVEALGNVYGEVYELSLANRKIDNVKKASGKLTVTFEKSVDSTLVATQIVAPLSGGGEQAYTVSSSEEVVVIENYSAASFKYRSVYRPEPKAIDLFYSKYEDYLTP